MDWISDVNRGAWLRKHLDPSWCDMHVFVPHGFKAYARVFHPATRDRPADTGTWHGYAGTDVFDFEEEKIIWAAVADTFGAKMHSLASTTVSSPARPGQIRAKRSMPTAGATWNRPKATSTPPCWRQSPAILPSMPAHRRRVSPASGSTTVGGTSQPTSPNCLSIRAGRTPRLKTCRQRIGNRLLFHI